MSTVHLLTSEITEGDKFILYSGRRESIHSLEVDNSTPPTYTITWVGQPTSTFTYSPDGLVLKGVIYSLESRGFECWDFSRRRNSRWGVIKYPEDIISKSLR